MTYVDRLLPDRKIEDANWRQPIERQPLLLVVEDDDATTAALQPICEFLDVAIERIPSQLDLANILREFRPMGVITELDCQGQDGCHVMITIADFDRTLPILLLTGDEPSLAGAVDAVEEIWQLESVSQSPRLPSVGEIVDFIFKAGRKGRFARMMPVQPHAITAPSDILC
jgi:DNA-binding NtrC family response regulator